MLLHRRSNVRVFIIFNFIYTQTRVMTQAIRRKTHLANTLVYIILVLFVLDRFSFVPLGAWPLRFRLMRRLNGN